MTDRFFAAGALTNVDFPQAAIYRETRRKKATCSIQVALPGSEEDKNLSQLFYYCLHVVVNLFVRHTAAVDVGGGPALPDGFLGICLENG